jgi:hypothetical protein
MLSRIPKVLLLLALLAALVASSVPVFAGSRRCSCVKDLRPFPVGCHFDPRTSQCVNIGCPGSCY